MQSPSVLADTGLWAPSANTRNEGGTSLGVLREPEEKVRVRWRKGSGILQEKERKKGGEQANLVFLARSLYLVAEIFSILDQLKL